MVCGWGGRMVRILFVDDELPILRALQRSLIDDEFEVFLAEGGEEALRILAEQPMDIVVSDVRMPGMDGHQLLKRVKKEYPGIIRMVLSGYAEQKDVFNILLDGSAKLYLPKPWEDGAFKETIQRLFNTRMSLQKKEATAVLSDLEWLPAMDDIYSRLIRMISEEATAGAIACLIEQDPAVAAKILQMVNSAFFGIKTGSVRQAIVYLGLTVVRDVVMAARFFDMPSIRARKGVETLWSHSVLVNRLVGQTYDGLLHRKLSDNFASAGLLCDVGILVLLDKSPNYTRKLMGALKADISLSLEKLEMEEFGIGHQEIGARLLEWWELPYSIVEAALYHHCPGNSNVINKEIVSVVHLADFYAWRILGRNIEGSPDRSVFETLKVTETECENFYNNVDIQSNGK